MAQAMRAVTADFTRGQQRHDDLKAMLEARVRTLSEELHGRLRGVRTDLTARPHDGQDFGELADTDMQDEIQFALLEMKAETLNKMHEALLRLEHGRYGHCHECGGEIAAARLRALPFALRCTSCEARREVADQQAQVMARRAAPLFDLRS